MVLDLTMVRGTSQTVLHTDPLSVVIIALGHYGISWTYRHAFKFDLLCATPPVVPGILPS